VAISDLIWHAYRHGYEIGRMTVVAGAEPDNAREIMKSFLQSLNSQPKLIIPKPHIGLVEKAEWRGLEDALAGRPESVPRGEEE
jgi:hypothetical protein